MGVNCTARIHLRTPAASSPSPYPASAPIVLPPPSGHHSSASSSQACGAFRDTSQAPRADSVEAPPRRDISRPRTRQRRSPLTRTSGDAGYPGAGLRMPFPCGGSHPSRRHPAHALNLTPRRVMLLAMSGLFAPCTRFSVPRSRLVRYGDALLPHVQSADSSSGYVLEPVHSPLRLECFICRDDEDVTVRGHSFRACAAWATILSRRKVGSKQEEVHSLEVGPVCSSSQSHPPQRRGCGSRGHSMSRCHLRCPPHIRPQWSSTPSSPRSTRHHFRPSIPHNKSTYIPEPQLPIDSPL
ncbi:hypothetical protein C8R46DRAFT_1139628 [Mycena filopes]|nr:hypothetical protein C8R46DRAFT_1139628 [Mycena filopes]